MRCSEAEEWMNRYLDHDLTVEEQQQLFRHLDDCAECAEKFEMLKLLSDKLMSLPDVKPRYSLVDAILPQLDEIDKADAETSGYEPAPSMMAQAPLMFSTADEEKRERIAVRRRRQRWARIAGGAAAAVILVFFIYQFQPKEIPNAEPAVQLDAAENSAAESSAEPSNSNNQAGDDFGRTKLNEANPSAGSDANPGTLKQQTSLSPEETPDPAASKAGADASEPGANSSASAGPASSAADAGKQGGDPKLGGQEADRHEKIQTGNSGAGETSGNGSSADASSPPAPAAGNPSADQMMLFDSSAADAGASGAGGEGANADKQQKSPAISPKIDTNKFFGIASLLPANQWVSEDGNYVAILEDGHLDVYDISQGGRVKIYDDPILGTWGQGAWGPQENIFSYTVDQDGQKVESKVDAQAAAASLQK